MLGFIRVNIGRQPLRLSYGPWPHGFRACVFRLPSLADHALPFHTVERCQPVGRLRGEFSFRLQCEPFQTELNQFFAPVGIIDDCICGHQFRQLRQRIRLQEPPGWVGQFRPIEEPIIAHQPEHD